MKTKYLPLILLTLMETGSLMAQKLFTLEELNFGGKNAAQFYPELWQLRWEDDLLIDAASKPAIVIDRATGND